MFLGDVEREWLGNLGVNEALRRAFMHLFNMPADWVRIIEVCRAVDGEGVAEFSHTAIRTTVMNGHEREHIFRLPNGETHLPLGSHEQAEAVRSLAER